MELDLRRPRLPWWVYIVFPVVFYMLDDDGRDTFLTRHSRRADPEWWAEYDAAKREATP